MLRLLYILRLFSNAEVVMAPLPVIVAINHLQLNEGRYVLISRIQGYTLALDQARSAGGRRSDQNATLPHR